MKSGRVVEPDRADGLELVDVADVTSERVRRRKFIFWLLMLNWLLDLFLKQGRRSAFPKKNSVVAVGSDCRRRAVHKQFTGRCASPHLGVGLREVKRSENCACKTNVSSCPPKVMEFDGKKVDGFFERFVCKDFVKCEVLLSAAYRCCCCCLSFCSQFEQCVHTEDQWRMTGVWLDF
jgi:hypothetical protein